MAGAAEPLVIAGSGGFGRETAELVRAINASETALWGGTRWELLGYLDDRPELAGTSVSGAKVLGPLDELAALADARVVVCTGSPADFGSKKRIVERLGLPPERYATLVHPTAVIPDSCRLGPGSVVLAGVVATVDVTLGAHVGVMPQTVLTHDDRIEDFAILGAGVRLAGAVQVGEGAYVGAGALVRENRRVGAGALVAMGAVVTRDVPDGEVWAGVPARFVRAVEPLAPDAAR
jgi:sugar O-acyltransferase (sialic acid O-acetyltransferase NeuD family)